MEYRLGKLAQYVRGWMNYFVSVKLTPSSQAGPGMS
jgi:hypothetical protein